MAQDCALFAFLQSNVFQTLLSVFLVLRNRHLYDSCHMRFRNAITPPILFSIFALCVASFGVTTVVASTTYSCPASLTAANTTVVGSTCYAYYTIALSWPSAVTACSGMNGYLARIRSAEIDNAISSIASTDVWFGASDDNANIVGASEGNFFWLGDSTAFWTGGQAGSPVGGAYTNWETGEPNNSSTENCALKYSYGSHRWNDYYCANGRHYVCELAAIANVETAPVSQQRSGGQRPETLKKLIDQAVARRNGEQVHTAAPLAASVVVVSSKASSQSVVPVVSSSSSKKSTSSVGGSAISSLVKNKSTDERIVVTADLNLRTDSRINAYASHVLHKGYVVTLLTIVDKDWAYVQTKSGFKGYVWRKHLTK